MSARYRATSKIVVQSAADPLGTGDVESIERRLATIQVLLTTRETFRRAARRVRAETAPPSTTRSRLPSTRTRTSSTSSQPTTPRKELLRSPMPSPPLSSPISERTERRRINCSGRCSRGRRPARRSPRGAGPNGRADIREQLRSFELGEASTSTELELAEAARPPSEPYAPHPDRNAIFAFFASSFLAALIVLAPGPAQAARHRDEGAEPPPRPSADGRDPVRPPPVRRSAEDAEGGRVRGVPDPPGLAAHATPRPASRSSS